MWDIYGFITKLEICRSKIIIKTSKIKYVYKISLANKKHSELTDKS